METLFVILNIKLTCDKGKTNLGNRHLVPDVYADVEFRTGSPHLTTHATGTLSREFPYYLHNGRLQTHVSRKKLGGYPEVSTGRNTRSFQARVSRMIYATITHV